MNHVEVELAAELRRALEQDAMASRARLRDHIVSLGPRASPLLSDVRDITRQLTPRVFTTDAEMVDADGTVWCDHTRQEPGGEKEHLPCPSWCVPRHPWPPR